MVVCVFSFGETEMKEEDQNDTTFMGSTQPMSSPLDFS